METLPTRPMTLGDWFTMVMWLDAADASTITMKGGNVVQWKDKSGNSRHLSQGAEPPTIDVEAW
jgi:hypothetical protein